jgi:U5 small nuclear ribonucleoprotein component
LKNDVFSLDVKPLLRTVLREFFGPPTSFVDMLVKYVPSPQENALDKVSHIYTGPHLSEDGEGNDDIIFQSLATCDPNGPLFIHVTKLYPTSDATKFNAFGRVMSGTVSKGQVVRVLGENYSKYDEEDMSVNEVEGVALFESR